MIGRLAQDIAIDLGTANILAYVGGRGIVFDEPSVVAIIQTKGQRRILAVGREAKQMVGRTPGNIQAIRPMRGGVIADFEVAEELIKYIIGAVSRRSRLARPRVLVSVPSGATSVERRAIEEASRSAGAGKVYLIDEPLAAALGTGCAVFEPVGSMIVDIGGGTTEVALISLGAIVVANSTRMAGDAMDEAIKAYLRRVHNLIVGDESAERIKIAIGSALPPTDGGGRSIDVRGRDAVKGVPVSITVSEKDIAYALAEPISAIIDIIRTTLETVPPELGSDLFERGIMLTGGGGLLRNLDAVIRNNTGLPVVLADAPLTSVVRGAGLALEEFRRLSTVFVEP